MVVANDATNEAINNELATVVAREREREIQQQFFYFFLSNPTQISNIYVGFDVSFLSRISTIRSLNDLSLNFKCWIR